MIVIGEVINWENSIVGIFMVIVFGFVLLRVSLIGMKL